MVCVHIPTCTGVRMPMCGGLASIDCHLTFPIFLFFCHCSLQFFPQVIESFVCNSQLTYYFLRLFLRRGPLWNLELTSSAKLAGPWIPGLHLFLLSGRVTYMCHPARMIMWVLESELDLHVYRASCPPLVPVHNYMRTLREGIKMESVLQNVSNQAGETHSPTSVVTSLLSGVTQALLHSNDTQETSTKQGTKLGEWNTPCQLIPGGQKHPTTVQFTNNSSKQSPARV